MQVDARQLIRIAQHLGVQLYAMPDGYHIRVVGRRLPEDLKRLMAQRRSAVLALLPPCPEDRQ